MAEACVICTCALLIKISYYDYSLHLLKQIVRSSNTFQCNFGHIFKCNWCGVCYMLAILILPAIILFSIAILLCAMRSLLKKSWLYYKRFRKPFPDTFYGLITFLLTGIECIYFLTYISCLTRASFLIIFSLFDWNVNIVFGYGWNVFTMSNCQVSTDKRTKYHQCRRMPKAASVEVCGNIGHASALMILG